MKVLILLKGISILNWRLELVGGVVIIVFILKVFYLLFIWMESVLLMGFFLLKYFLVVGVVIIVVCNFFKFWVGLLVSDLKLKVLKKFGLVICMFFCLVNWFFLILKLLVR